MKSPPLRPMQPPEKRPSLKSNKNINHPRVFLLSTLIRMKLLGKPLWHWAAVCLLSLTGLLFNGCRTDPPSPEVFADLPVLPSPAVTNLPPIAHPSAAPTNNAASVRLHVGD